MARKPRRQKAREAAPEPAPAPHVSPILEERPGYVEAIAECRRQITHSRECAFLDLPHKLCGIIECEQLKLSHWQALAATGNALICGGAVSLHDLAQFIWVLSLQRKEAMSKGASDEEMAEAGAAFVAREEFHEDEFSDLHAEVSEYLDEALQDIAKGGGESAGSACISVHITADIHEHYPRLADWILTLPLAAIFQFMRRADDKAYLAAGRTPPSFSRLDKIRAQFAFGS